MKAPGNTRGGDAFSRVELCAVLAAVFLLALLALPALAQPFGRSQRLQCLNNLRQIGQAFQVWVNDHNDEFPFYLSPDKGGLRGLPDASKAYYQFAVLSNELISPRILACPSDSVLLAADFGSGLNGLLAPGFQNSSVSYFVSHGRIAIGPELLTGDRNVVTSTTTVACPFFGTTQTTDLRVLLAWKQGVGVHGDSGNVLLTSGAVLETGNASLRAAALAAAANPALPMHLVVPR